MDKRADLATLLEDLLANDIEFVLVGGLAAVVQARPLPPSMWTSSIAGPRRTWTACWPS